MNRELYGRIAIVQKVLGIDADDSGDNDGEPVELGNVRLTPVHPIRMAHRSIPWSDGWGAGFSVPLTIATLTPPCCVLAIYFTVETPFPQDAARMKFFVSYNQRPPNNYSGIDPDDHPPHLLGRFGYAYQRHLAGSTVWTSQDQWQVEHGPIPLIYRAQYSESDPDHYNPFWQNALRWIGNSNEIESGYPLIITGGFMNSDWYVAPDWGTTSPAGEAYVTVLYMESVSGTLQVPLADIGQYDLMKVNPVLFNR